MKKLIILIAIGLLIIPSVSAQTGLIGAKLQDSASGEALIGATIVLQSDSFKSGAISGADGGFLISSVPKGSYTLKVNFLGYSEYKQTVVVPGSQYLGILKISKSTEAIDGIDVKERYAIGRQKGDTTEYNANAFKTTQNASAKDLVGKLPGVRTDGGDVKAEGESVQQVLVDGKPFFGQDANAALGTLPAEVVDKIQVFDDQSEQSKASGIDDGTRVKTINIVTKINMRYGEFGKVYVGGGTDSRYSSGFNINMFRGEQRVSLLGQVNNINQQNFSTSDLLGVVADNSGRGHRRGPSFMRGFSVGSDASDFLVNPQNGLITTAAGGLNYQDSWSDKWDASASYFYNKATSSAISDLYQLYYLEELDGQSYEELDSSSAVNVNHRFNAKLTYQLNDKASFFILPSVTVQQNTGDQESISTTARDNSIENIVYNLFNSDYSAFYWTNDVMFRQNFEKTGRSFFVHLNAGQKLTNGESALDYNLTYDDPTTWSYQQAQLNQDALSLGASVMYSEPIGEKGMSAFATYDISNEQTLNDQLTSDIAVEEDPIVLTNLSNYNNNDWISHTVGLGIRKFDKKFGYVLRFKYEMSKLLNDQELPAVSSVQKSFNNVLPFGLIRLQNENKGGYFIMYRSYTNAPSASQLQQNIDNSNPLQLSIGNPELDQQYTHYFRFRYKSSDTKKSTVFFAGIRANYSNSYLGTSTYTAIDDEIVDGYLLQRGAQISKPVNLSNYANFNAMLNYGFPVKALSSNLNIDFSSSFINTPSMINNVVTSTSSYIQSLGWVLSSNISEKIDFTISTTSNYSSVVNALNENLNTNYFMQQSRIKYDWIMPLGITFRTQLEHQKYYGLTGSLDNTVLLWTAGIGKQLFKDKRGEIQISVFDILNQNNQISQHFYDSYFEESTSNVLTRYAMLSFSYNLSKFREKKSKDTVE